MKIVYDNTAHDPDLSADWGFGCLIECGPLTILFDTGQDGNILLQNLEKMDEDPNEVDCVVISHNHEDHMGGLYDFLQVNPQARVVLADPKAEDLSRLQSLGVKVHQTPEPTSLYKGLSLSGAMGRGIKEQALIINTPAGLILIAGCSHPGVLNMVEKAKELFRMPVYMVLGGFHNMPESHEGMQQIIQKFRKLGVQKVAPAHCTNEIAKAWFKQAYADNYIQIGAGRELHFRLRKR
ncbi:MAG: MBL fold metallo-hydrolase [Desulfohalobiaceae bacterium]